MLDFSKRYTTALIIGEYDKKIFDAIRADIEKAGLKIEKCTGGIYDENTWQMFYNDHKEKDFFEDLVELMSASRVQVWQIVATEKHIDPIARWREYIGPTDPAVAKRTAPESLRARHGNSIADNGSHGSDSWESAQKEERVFHDRLEGCL